MHLSRGLWNRFYTFCVSHLLSFSWIFFVDCERENCAKCKKCVEVISSSFRIRVIFCKMTAKCLRNAIRICETCDAIFWKTCETTLYTSPISHYHALWSAKMRATFDCIHLLELSIPIEIVLSDSSKTVPWTSCKLPVRSWLHLDNRFLFVAFFCTELYPLFFNIYLFN